MITIAEAIKAINSKAEFSCTDDDISSIEWLNNTTPISSDDITSKQTELENDYTAKQYQRDRAKEYPDFIDYLDGIVKGDQAQIDKYIADCQAVKAKYPKPTGE